MSIRRNLRARTDGVRSRPVRRAALAAAAAASIAAAAVSVGVLAPPAGAAPRPPAAATVLVRSFRFQPTKVVVRAGGTVTWRNRDDILHTVTAAAGSAVPFDRKLDGPKAVVKVTFPKPGTYTYACAIHTFMTGTVEVRA